MNSLELQMVELLKDLKKNQNVVEVKAEFEAEAARIHEVMRLKEIASRAGVGLIIKIGGAEAITDMFEAQHIGVTGIVGPMIESAYAASKYFHAIKKYFHEDLRNSIKFGITIETVDAANNLDAMLSLPDSKLLNFITVGRVDMSGSIGLKRNEINNKKMYEITKEVFQKAERRKLKTGMGGGIAIEAIPFIKNLIKLNLLDQFETRKIVFRAAKKSTTKQIANGIIKANKFELLWLENKKNYYSQIFTEDDSRIEMLKKRIK